MKILVLGLGGSGGLHLKAYRRLWSEFDVDVFVSDIDKAKERHYANQGFKIGNLQDEYDMVDICAPTHYHSKLALEWISRSNVLIEKPMCMTLDEAKEMVKASKENDGFLAVCHNQLFYPLFHDDKQFENVTFAVVSRTSNEKFPDWVFTDGGGRLFESGYHGLYIFFHIFGLQGIEPQLKTVHKNGEEYHFIFDTGIVNCITSAHSHDCIRLHFSDNNIKHVNCWFHSPWVFGHLSRKLSVLDLYLYLLLHQHYPYSDTHFNLLRSVLRSLEDGLPLDRRLSTDLSMQVLKVLNHANKVL